MLGLTVAFLCGACWAQDGVRVKVVCYNTHHAQGTDGALDVARVARVISSESPDLVGLQEIDSMCGRTNRVNQVAEYARLTGMNGVFGQAIPYDGGGYGNAILSKAVIGTVRRVPLPGAESRVALFADVTVGSGAATVPMTFVTTHWMVGDAAAQQQSATIINTTVKERFDANRPIVLCGDMNARAGSAAITEMDKEWEIASFNFGIDWIVYRPASSWRVVSVRKLTTGDAAVASDHAPVVMELAYVGPATRVDAPARRSHGVPVPVQAAPARLVTISGHWPLPGALSVAGRAVSAVAGHAAANVLVSGGAQW